MITLTIPDEVISGNRVLRMHYRARKRVMWNYMWSIRAAGGEDVSYPAFYGAEKKFHSVNIHSFRKRLLDVDRLYSGATLLVDAIRHLHLIYNDSPKWLSLAVIQSIDGKNPRTEIRIY